MGEEADKGADAGRRCASWRHDGMQAAFRQGMVGQHDLQLASSQGGGGFPMLLQSSNLPQGTTGGPIVGREHGGLEMAAANVLIAFYSRNSSTEAMAQAVAEGARAAGAEVRLRRAREFVGPEVMAKAPGWADNAARVNALYEAPNEANAEWADAIAFGTPTRFGATTAELKAYIDSLGGLWFQGKLNGKVGSAFTSTSTVHGGNESTLISLYNPMAQLGLIIVPLGYADPALFKAGTPYGASTVSGQRNEPPGADDLEVARFQGRRVTMVAQALHAGGVTATKQGAGDQVGH